VLEIMDEESVRSGPGERSSGARHWFWPFIPVLLILAGLLWSGFARRLIENDTVGYLWCAETIARGEIYPTDRYYPFYPLLIRLSFVFLGHTLTAVHFFPWLLGGLTPVFLYGLALKLFRGRPGVALASAVAYMVFPLQMIRMNTPYTEPVYVFVLVSSLLIYCCLSRGSWVVVPLLGSLSVLTLIRYEGILFSCTLVICWLFEYRGKLPSWKWVLAGVFLVLALQGPFLYANLIRQEKGDHETVVQHALPMNHIERWANISSSRKSLEKNLNLGLDAVKSVSEQTAELAGSVSFAVIAVSLVAYGLLGAYGVLFRWRSPVLLAILGFLVIYLALELFYIRGSILRHLSRVVPLVVIVMVAGWFFHYQAIRSCPPSLWKGILLLVSILFWAAFLAASLWLNVGYLGYRTDMARASMWNLFSRPYALPEVKDKESETLLWIKPFTGLTATKRGLAVNLFELRLREFYGQSREPSIGEDADYRAVLDFNEPMARLPQLTVNGDLEALYHPSYRGFLGVIGPSRYKEKTLLLELSFNRPVAWIAVCDNHISLYSKAGIRLELSWDGGKHWQVLYVDQSEHRFPKWFEGMYEVKDPSVPVDRALLRYRFGPSKKPKCQVRGLLGKVWVFVKFRG
jgi:hypothetical protein